MIRGVIALTGMMGSGKSTLAGHVAAAVPDVVVYAEDDYSGATERSLADIEAWWDRGADIAEFDLSDLVHAIQQSLTSSRPPHVLLETQFGRLHPALAPLITHQIWIDVPADIALARKVRQLSARMRHDAEHNDPRSGLLWIEQFCQGYLATTRKLFESQRIRLRDVADRVIDGTQNDLDMLREFLKALPPTWAEPA